VGNRLHLCRHLAPGLQALLRQSKPVSRRQRLASQPGQPLAPPLRRAAQPRGSEQSRPHAARRRPDPHFRPRANSTTQWIGDADIVGQLEKTATGWTYRDSDDAVETYDASGRRLTRTDRDGLSLSFSYASGAHTLSHVEDNFGRRLTLTHDSQGLLSELTDPAGQKVTYTYDAAGNLITVTYPDRTTRSYTYTSVPVAGQIEPALLTGLTDENGIPYARWTYDSSALVASSEHAGGVDHTA
jgi:YD repeat-containing protein